jgi:hypothetical protein
MGPLVQPRHEQVRVRQAEEAQGGELSGGHIGDAAAERGRLPGVAVPI